MAEHVGAAHVVAADVLGDAAGAVVGGVAAAEEHAEVGHGRGGVLVVGDELALLLVLAQLPALRQGRDLDDDVDEVCWVVVTLHALTGAGHRGRGMWHLEAIGARNKEK